MPTTIIVFGKEDCPPGELDDSGYSHQSMDWHFFHSNYALQVLTGRVKVRLSSLRLTTPDCFHKRVCHPDLDHPLQTEARIVRELVLVCKKLDLTEQDTGLSLFRSISSQSFAFVWLKVAPSVSSPKITSESAAKEEESSIGEPSSFSLDPSKSATDRFPLALLAEGIQACFGPKFTSPLTFICDPSFFV
ncbi:hypothetical protein M9H77_23681 [Catharanthus roseus]|uniref:Uncharacterized protein n=1 Tax=Catharanthus roseus TaxID=4058 RepID=A0ACC0AY47_CATRO|nr:hypothetical protein M9H77_23681 [Catharanthus roseus]